MSVMNIKRKQAGVGLIEVLIAVMVLVLGLTALMKFQGEMLQSGTVSQQRSEALSLAQRKMDDLRGFTTLYAPAAAPTWSAGMTTAMAYAYIDDNTGGKMAPGAQTGSLNATNNNGLSISNNTTYN